MTTWYRGRVGNSSTASGDIVLDMSWKTWAPGNNETIYRIIVDWNIDLIANGTVGAINTGTPLTLGLVFTNSSSSSPPAPAQGPATNPTADWLWWQGGYFTSLYNFVPGGTDEAFGGVGRIDRDVRIIPSQTLYSKLWLVGEVQNNSGLWTQILLQAWGQAMTKPTV